MPIHLLRYYEFLKYEFFAVNLSKEVVGFAAV